MLEPIEQTLPEPSITYLSCIHETPEAASKIQRFGQRGCSEQGCRQRFRQSRDCSKKCRVLRQLLLQTSWTPKLRLYQYQDSQTPNEAQEGWPLTQNCPPQSPSPQRGNTTQVLSSVGFDERAGVSWQSIQDRADICLCAR